MTDNPPPLPRSLDPAFKDTMARIQAASLARLRAMPQLTPEQSTKVREDYRAAVKGL